MSVFECIPETAPDAILQLGQDFKKDQSPDKVNLGIGAYRDEEGKPWILPSVREAEKIISSNLDKYNKEYPPQPGFDDFLKVAQEFLLGENHQAIKEGRVASCQSLSGTGSLHIGMKLIHKFYPGHDFYLPKVTWANHRAIYGNVFDEVKYKEYTYLYADGTLKVDFENLKKDLMDAKDGSVFLFHACAHNPSGIDLTKAQWNEVQHIFEQKHHVMFFDIAYQGFASGSFEEDGFAVRQFANSKVECLVAQSFSKNFGLYGERIGCCHVIHQGDAHLSRKIQCVLMQFVRIEWSMSPIHGAYIVEVIGTHPELKAQFMKDIETMSGRIKLMRQMLYDELIKLQTPGDWTHIITCIGMFTYTGLTPEQCDWLKFERHIYMVRNGRMSMCGLTKKNVAYVAKCINEVLKAVPKKN